MLENSNLVNNNGVKLYIRHIPSLKKTKNAVILLNSKSLCVESSMGVRLGSISYGEYLASKGIDAFLIDLRGYGLSDNVPEFFNGNGCTTIEDYFNDIKFCSEYIKNLLGTDTQISIVGFSFLGPISLIVSHRYPGIFKNIILLNPNWERRDYDPPAGVDFIDKSDNKNYSTVNLYKIKNRSDSAQPNGKEFRETQWFEEVSKSIETFSRTYDAETKSWKIFNPPGLAKEIQKIKGMSNSTSNVLLLNAQYDIENPYFMVKRLFDDLRVKNKYIKVLPNATHLCIWEKSRHSFYNITSEFIL